MLYFFLLDESFEKEESGGDGQHSPQDVSFSRDFIALSAFILFVLTDVFLSELFHSILNGYSTIGFGDDFSDNSRVDKTSLVEK